MNVLLLLRIVQSMTMEVMDTTVVSMRSITRTTASVGVIWSATEALAGLTENPFVNIKKHIVSNLTTLTRPVISVY